jgi:hypothetical protein
MSDITSPSILLPSKRPFDISYQLPLEDISMNPKNLAARLVIAFCCVAPFIFAPALLAQEKPRQILNRRESTTGTAHKRRQETSHRT